MEDWRLPNREIPIRRHAWAAACMDEVIRERREILGVELTVGVADREDRVRQVDLARRDDLREDFLRGPLRVGRLARHLAGEADGVEGHLDGKEIVGELPLDARRLLLGALLARLHREHQYNVRLGFARRRDALDRNAEHLNILLVIRQEHEVEHVTPPRGRAEPGPLVAQFSLVQRPEVRVIEVRHFLCASVCEKSNVHAQFPSLVPSKHRHGCEHGKKQA
mmetsp:Transcript_63574/g.194428  ORF Transcript_63574/g.194428 Transcript_63574/m.194428 type:complete len:222 (+) Transcript_63574:817-1482(+)